MSRFDNFPDPIQVAVIGASGGIGSALINELLSEAKVTRVFSLSRCREKHAICNEKLIHGYLDLEDETSLNQLGDIFSGEKLDVVIVATGVLHGEGFRPEKSLKDLNIDNLNKLFAINAFAPALIARQLLPCLPKSNPAVFAAISARVGSISDNRLGGWYSYRASKAALNMLLKTISIESARSRPKAVICGLHPGTVDTALSEPFQRNVPSGKLFSPEKSAAYLLDVVSNLKPEHSGKVFDWAGKEIPS
jgi:NAD(P)-dependent dehydrogenase (short-subunit alcohol dehydrogenase family)